MSLSPPMKRSGYILAIFLWAHLAPVSAQQKTATRPAWTSTLQCLAPLAREARIGESPLKLDQAFFDGPFTRPTLPASPEFFPVSWPSKDTNAKSAAHLGAGYSYLLAFDDLQAARHFREAIQDSTTRAAGFLGLALCNSDAPRRFECFLNAATEAIPTSSPPETQWVKILNAHFSGQGFLNATEMTEKWAALALDSGNACIAAALLRKATLLNLQGYEKLHLEKLSRSLGPMIPNWIPSYWNLSTDTNHFNSQPFPEFLASQPRLLQLAGTVSPDLISRAEFKRLEEIGSIMPEASLDLGPFTRNLMAESDASAAERIANRLQAMPRDAFSPGTKYRRLSRTDSPWVVGRTAKAELLLKRSDWDALLHLERGFLPQDRAEYFAWQVVAAAKSERDFNLWLAALRREPGSEFLVEQCEAFLEAMSSQQEDNSYQIPGVPKDYHLAIESKRITSSQPSSVPDVVSDWQSRPAADFSLPNWQNKEFSLSKWSGQPIIVIFFLGGGCLHCVEQLTAFGPWNEKFEAAGIQILAVSTDPVEILSDTLKNEDNPEENFPIPILSDHSLAVFNDWGVVDEFDERAIHATFLIDAQGNIIWEEKGNTPYMHPDFLLYEATRLLNSK